MSRCVQRWWSMCVLALAVMGALACAPPSSEVAKVGGEPVTMDQWRAYLAAHAKEAPSSALDGVVRREVAWVLAHREGQDKERAWSEAMKQARISVLSKAYLDTLPLMPAFTEAQAREYYRAHREERHVQHVLLQTREEADLVLVRLKRGEKVEPIARALSKDPDVARNGGDLGWIERPQVVKPFADAAFSAKTGEWVGPFKTDYGWHVARVTEVREPTEQDFMANKAEILKQMDNMRQEQRKQTALAPLKVKFPLQASAEALERDRTTEWAAGDEDLAAGHVGHESISLADLKRYMGGYFKSSGQSHSLGPAMKAQFLDLMADDLRLAAAAEEAGLDKKPEVAAELWDLQREAGYALLQDHVLASYKVPDDAVSSQYGAHPGRYRGLGSFHLLVLVSDQSEAAEKAVLGAKAGMDWAALVGRFGNKEATGQWDLGWIDVQRLQGMIPASALKALLTQPLGYVAGPVQGPGGYEVFRVLDRKEGPALPLSECRDQVAKDYIAEHGQEVLSAYLDGPGRQGISVKTYPANAGAAKR